MTAKKKKKCALGPLSSSIKMTILLLVPPATKLTPEIPPESGHPGPTTFFACNHNGVGPTTTSRRTHACRVNQTLCPMPSALHADSCSVHKRHGCPLQATFSALNKSLVAHQPTLCTLWVRLGHLEKLPTDEHVWTGIITCGGFRRGSGLQVFEGPLTLPFTDFPSWGTSSELQAGKAGDSRTVGSEEEATMLPSGPKRGSSSKRRGEVDGGGD